MQLDALHDIITTQKLRRRTFPLRLKRPPEDLPWWIRKSGDLYSRCLSGAISEASYLQGLRLAGLDDTAVRERIVYQPEDIASMALDLLPGITSVPAIVRKALTAAVGPLSKKLWSAKIYAWKPLR